MVLPDYAGGSLVNLAASLAGALGDAAPPCPPLRDLPPEALADARTVVLVVADGMGDVVLRAHGSGALEPFRHGSITSVFPSTTATAIPALHSGLPPRLHGLTGWNMQHRELGTAIQPLPYQTRFGRASLAACRMPPEALFHPRRLFDCIAAEGTALLPRDLADTPFSAWHCGGARRQPYKDLPDLFARAAKLARRRAGGRRFVLAYWPDLDSAAHAKGVASAQVAVLLAAFEAEFARFLERIQGSDTVVLVTADHGFVDVPPERILRLESYPEIRGCLALPLSGEPRVAHCHLRVGTEERFDALVNERLGHCLALFRGTELVDAGWYGPGPTHPALPYRLGDRTLLMKEGWVVDDRLPVERPLALVGYHGGTSADEMLVPLLIAQTA